MAGLILATGCGAHPEQPSSVKRDWMSTTELAHSAWVGRGYFVDTPWSRAAPAWSLAETYWGVRRAGAHATNLDPRALSRWLTPALYGKLSGSGDPPLWQVRYASTVGTAAGFAFSTSDVAKVVDSFRVGGRYRDGTPGDDPSWADTLVAQQALRAIHRDVPKAVADSINHAVSSTQTGADVDTVINQTSALLDLYADLPRTMRRSSPAAVDAVVGEVTATLRDLPQDPVTLAIQADLSATLRKLGRRAPQPDPQMCAIVTGSGLSLQNQAQLDLFGEELRCRPRSGIDYRAPSVSGWPAPPAGVDVLMQSTEAGFALDKDVGVERRPIREWLSRQVAALQSPDAIDRLAADRLALAVGKEPPYGLPKLTSRVHTSGHSMLAALDADVLRRSPRLQRSPIMTDLREYATALMATEDLTLIDALALESIGRLFQDRALQVRAQAVAESLRTRSGAFRYSTKIAAASVTVNAIGAWITGTRIESRSLQQAGFCSHDVCADSVKVTPDTASIGVSAMLHVCKVPGCGGVVPVFLY